MTRIDFYIKWFIHYLSFKAQYIVSCAVYNGLLNETGLGQWYSPAPLDALYGLFPRSTEHEAGQWRHLFVNGLRTRAHWAGEANPAVGRRRRSRTPLGFKTTSFLERVETWRSDDWLYSYFYLLRNYLRAFSPKNVSSFLKKDASLFPAPHESGRWNFLACLKFYLHFWNCWVIIIFVLNVFQSVNS